MPRPSPVATGVGGLSPPNYGPSSPKLNYETLQISGVLANFGMTRPMLKTLWRRFCPCHASILRRSCAYYSTRTLFSRCCIMRHCDEHKLTAVS